MTKEEKELTRLQFKRLMRIEEKIDKILECVGVERMMIRCKREEDDEIQDILITLAKES